MPAALLLTGLLLAPAHAGGQTGRAALLAGHDAYDMYELETAVRHFSMGLNPAAGPGDSSWVLGVYRLAEFLDELGEERLGDTWLRWAFRHLPEMPLDTVSFPAALIQRFSAARAFADTTRPTDLTLRLSWSWPAGAPTASQPGTISVRRRDYAVAVQLDDGSLFAAGSDRSLPSGTHRLRLSAAGYRPASIRVEILPGVTTVVDVDMVPLYAGALYVASEPWGVVYVDGDSVGYTMLGAHPLSPGSHRIRIVRQGYLPFDTTVTVIQSDSLRLGTVRLRSAGGGGQP